MRYIYFYDPNIEHATYKDLLKLRFEVLTPHIPLEKCFYDTDDLPDTFHLVYRQQGEVVGAATFFPEAYEGVASAQPYRLRQMGVYPEYGGRGIGRELVCEALELLRECHCDFLWCKAREVAFGFYLKLGLEFLSEMYEVPNIGPHKDMGMRLKLAFGALSSL